MSGKSQKDEEEMAGASCTPKRMTHLLYVEQFLDKMWLKKVTVIKILRSTLTLQVRILKVKIAMSNISMY